MFDIQARNEAIHIMTLKAYLELHPELRPLWAFFTALTLILSSKDFPEFLQGMLKVAKKYGVEFDTLQPTKELRDLLPLWHHLGEDPSRTQLNNSPQAKCLRINHNVVTVGDGLAIMNRIGSPDHRAHPGCTCVACSDDRIERRCKNPNACAVAVGTCLLQILPKWRPSAPDPPVAPPNPTVEGTSVFRPPPEISNLTDGFRIFTKARGDDPPPPLGAPPVSANESPVRAVIGGHIELSGTLDAKAAAGVWYAPNDPWNMGSLVPEGTAPEQGCGEIVAALLAAQAAPRMPPYLSQGSAVQ
ncbi:hypothetical protein B0H17DRAFT_1211984 [Mycena rosella]|uniref:Uncharacterized protein n=1 Tax=Mycena rosella TaxID=1033263 RepID=A0AAD7CSS8_MYCRO|nr:hypothetical protein B0H17DRAFT_1211984 [Mycena rosella]